MQNRIRIQFGMRSGVLTTLSIFLGLYFLLLGWLKVSSSLSREVHREFRRSFVQFTKHLQTPLALLGLRLSPKLYRAVWGWAEVASGTTLLLVPLKWPQIAANATLLLLSALAGLHTYKADLGFDRVAPNVVFCFMLTCRLIVEWQVSRRERRLELLRQRASLLLAQKQHYQHHHHLHHDHHHDQQLEHTPNKQQSCLSSPITNGDTVSRKKSD